MLAAKWERRQADERRKPLAAYRVEELARMSENFFGPDPAYHEARQRFVLKGGRRAATDVRSASSRGLATARTCGDGPL
jgi:putative two-component system hydrogenase maturation factor HypX/HoxX